MNADSGRRNYILLLLVVFGGFLIFGFSENIKGPALPRIQSEFSLNETQLGVLLALNSLGYLLACTFTSALAGRIGIKLTGIVAFGSMAAAGVLMYMSTGYLTISASYFVLYVGNGMLEIGLAIMAARIFTKNTGMMMNLAHFFYGLSSIAAPLLAASMMGWRLHDAELGWRGMYIVMLSLSLLPIIPSLLGRFPSGSQAPEDRTSYRSLIRDGMAWMTVAVLSFGVVSELAIGSWLVYYLEKAYGWSTANAAGMLSLFFVCFTVARLLLGPVTDRIGYTLSVMIFSATSGLCSLAGVLAGEQGAWLFAAAGFGIAPIYPTVMAILAKRYPRSTDTAITFTVTIMGVATVAGNFLIGFIIDFVHNLLTPGGEGAVSVAGLQAGYLFIASMALLCSVCCAIMYTILRRRGELV